MGRPPKPTATKILQGTFRPDRANAEPLVEQLPAPPKAPRYFRDHPTARREWRRVAPLLISQGTLAEIDLVALECYCLAYERAIEAEAIIASRRAALVDDPENRSRSALTFFSPNGYEQQIPEVSIALQARKELREFMTQFGMTPASRSRINIARKQQETVDPMEALLARP